MRQHCVFLLIALFFMPLAASADSPQLKVTADKVYIDVYSGPGRGYPIVHVIEKGETVNLLKRRTDWVKIEDHRGIKGWIRYEDLAHFIDPAGNHLSFALPDFDSYLDRNFELGVAIGDFNGAESLTLILGYKFSKNLTTEIRLEQATGQFSDNKLAHLNITHQPFPEWRISPYFLLGAGYIETSPSATLVETEDRSESIMLAGIGAYCYLMNQFVLRAEYNNHFLLTSREENEEIVEWKLGFSVFF